MPDILIDVSNEAYSIRCMVGEALGEMQRPSVLFRPTLSADGTSWCALYGEDLASGVAGFGDTPDAAMRAFDEAWGSQKTPAATRAERETEGGHRG